MIHAQRIGSQGSNPLGGVEPDRRAGEGRSQQRPQQEGFFRRLRALPPGEQKRVLANDPQFQSLSPERQKLIRERLQQWNSKTPQEKERIRQREEVLGGLSPAQRQEARNIAPQWRDLTDARRQAVMVAFRHLRDLPPDQRQSFLDSQNVREQFSPHERDILEGMNRLLANPGATASGATVPGATASGATAPGAIAPHNPAEYQKQQALSNFPELRELTDERRQAVMTTFRQLRTLPPDQRQSFLDSPSVREQFSPHERDLLEGMYRHIPNSGANAPNGPDQRLRQEALSKFPELGDLTPQRRQALMMAFHHLRDLPPDQRRSFLDGQRVQQMFSPHERDILEGMNKTLANSPPAAPNAPDQ